MSTPHAANTGTSVRYAHVDSLRGIAALLVVWLHVTEVFNRLPVVRANGDLLYRIADAIDPGRIGVVIFFAISGFVICSSLKGDLATTSREFLIKRFFRLYPAYWLAILLGSFSTWRLWGNALSTGLYAANITMIPTLFGYKNMMGLLWTLETELVFYLLCLLLFWCRILHKPLVLVSVCIVLLTLFAGFRLRLIPAPDISAWRSMPYHLAIMFWGGIARHCFDKPQGKVNIAGFSISLHQLMTMVAAIILLPLLVMAIWHWQQTAKTRELTLAAAYSVGLLAFFIGVFHVRLHHAILVWLGTISYSLYLFHGVFFTPMYWWARNYQDHPLAQLHMGVYLAITIILTIGCSHLVYRFIEAPSNRLARRLVAGRLPAKGQRNHV